MFKNLHLAKDIERLITGCCKDPWLQFTVDMLLANNDLNMFQAYILIWKCPGHLLCHSVGTDVVEWALKGSWFQGIRRFEHHIYTESISHLHQDVLLCETVKDCLRRSSTESRVGRRESELAAKNLENMNWLQRIAVRGIPSILEGSAGRSAAIWKVNYGDLRREKSAGKGSLKYLLQNVTSLQIIRLASRRKRIFCQGYATQNLMTVLGYAESNIN